MVVRIRAALRRRRRRALVLCAVIGLGAAVTLAHAGVGGDHMGDAMALCSVALVAGAAAAATLPHPALPLPRRPRPDDAAAPETVVPIADCVQRRARGDPAFLQVFRT